MGPSTGSSPCSDSCFKALRAAWEREGRTDGRVTKGRGGEERKRGMAIGWEESECHPSAAFQITLNSGKPNASRTLSPRLCCLWLPSTGCLSSLIGLTFPLSVLAVPRFSYVRWARRPKSLQAKPRQTLAACRVQTKQLKGRKKKSAGNSRGAALHYRLSNRPSRFVDAKTANLFKASCRKRKWLQLHVETDDLIDLQKKGAHTSFFIRHSVKR